MDQWERVVASRRRWGLKTRCLIPRGTAFFPPTDGLYSDKLNAPTHTRNICSFTFVSRRKPSRGIIQTGLRGNGGGQHFSTSSGQIHRWCSFHCVERQREASSGEVCGEKQPEGLPLTLISQNNSSEQESREKKEFSTTAQWTAPTAQRSHHGRSRVSCAPPRQEPPAPTLTYWLSPDRIYIQSRGREERDWEREGGGRGRRGGRANR